METVFNLFLVAVVVPQRKALEDWAVKHNSTNDFKSLFQNPKAAKYILDDLKKSFTFFKLCFHCCFALNKD